VDEVLSLLDPWLTLAIPWLYSLFLALARVGGVFLALPQFSRKSIPREAKGVVALAFASALAWLRPVAELPGEGLEFTLAMGVALEMLFGLGLGFILHVAFATVRLAGQLTGIEMGLSFAAIADPLNQAQGTIMSVLFGQIGVQLFLTSGLDRVALVAMADSVKYQPLGSGKLNVELIEAVAVLGDTMFRVGVGLALPITGALFALKLAMALLARVAPKIQIFSLAFTLTLLVGQLILGIAFPAMAGAISDYLAAAMDDFRSLAIGP